MAIKRHVPNFITLLNLMSGGIAAIFAVQGNLIMAAVFVGLGIFFDFFDGLAARALDVKSEMGLQLDSLADMITSGLVPGIVMYQLLLKALPGDLITSKEWAGTGTWWEWNFPILALIGLFITAASGYRLAKFNIDERQTDSFIGLPTPANALLILSLPLILAYQPHPWAVGLILNEWFLIILTLVSCYMLNAEIPLFALKFSDWSFGKNKLRYSFIAYCLLMIILFQFIAIPVIILSYVILSLLFPAEREQEEVVRG
ncbi:CDP-alcohol phosphatidyltransferase family protein [Antarcticibacterium sp. 1MA-6-2]|uniref:CDP-alcohol phosphatidyltransferase family protein n=1 Tax=Antarcticibacterium sp. 1MA-6-2 TaxID=2908210 RepID=UPI001F31108E|nr:CDP-alcohol phosphatidyltransferase family protein [Antarcticibacterium sp. 1MA-6-2]UJH92487.1 CDP-alcohol phosphatidyltransferase family protein [Antarcticibacterium sp. 1MA-6-2]